MNSKSKHALGLYYDWFGKRAFEACSKPSFINVPGFTNCSACGATGRLHSTNGGYLAYCDVCVTVGGSYEGIKRPGRMGEAWVAVLTPDSASLTTGNHENLNAFQSLPNTHVRHSTARQSLISAIISPPEPPFMIIRFGRSPVTNINQLRASYSKDLIYISGSDIERLNARLIRDSINQIKSSSFDEKLIRSTVSAYSRIARGISSGKDIQAAVHIIESAEEQSPGIKSLVRSLPLIESFEFNWILGGAYV